MTALTTVKLYGELGELFGKEFHFAVKTPVQAIRLLQANFRDFGKYLLEHSKPGYHIYVGKQTISEKELNHPVSSNDVIKIVPVVAGSSDNNFVNVVLGAALILSAPWTAAMLTGGLSGGVAVTGFIANIGWSLMLAGVAQTLFAPPPPDAPAEDPKDTPSYIFNGPVNTIKQGNPVPIGYGLLRVGSQVISTGIITNEEPIK